MRFAIAKIGYFDNRRDSSEQCELMIMPALAEPHGLASLTYTRTMFSGDLDHAVQQKYDIKFYDPTLAEGFYQQLVKETSQYSQYLPVAVPRKDDILTICIFKFPIFMAAFVILAADSRYGAPQEGLSAFRIEASLFSLPEVSLIEQNGEPGELMPLAHGERFWKMSSVSKVSKNVTTAQTAVTVPTSALSEHSVFVPKMRARRVDAEFDQDRFLRLFTDNEDLINNVRFVDFCVECHFKFPPTIDRKMLVNLSCQLTDAGLKNEMQEPSVDPLLSKMFPPIYKIIIFLQKSNLIDFLDQKTDQCNHRAYARHFIFERQEQLLKHISYH